MSLRLTTPLAVALLLASPAQASLPEPVRVMIEAAIATGDKAKVATVVELAKQTHPDDGEEIDALQRAFLDRQAELAAAETERQRQAIRSAGLFDRWGGKGEIGAYHSSGNSDNTGVTVALSLDREGIDWSHKLRARTDYQRSNGRTSREQYFAAYEPRYQMSPRLFGYALAQFEKDAIQGFSGRYAVSGGLGYHVVDTDTLDLSLKAGPAYRTTDYINRPTDSRIAGLLGLDFDWRVTDRLKLTQDSNMMAETGGEATLFVDSRNTSLNLITGLEAKVSDRLTTRLSYQVDYNSDAPAGAVSTDTLSRFSLVYGF